GIFTYYEQPFALTYLGTSLLVVYLPIAFTKDWLLKFLNPFFSWRGRSRADLEASYDPLDGLYDGAQKGIRLELCAFEVENQVSTVIKETEKDLIFHEVNPLVLEYKDDDDLEVMKDDLGVTKCDHARDVTPRDIAAFGFYLAPLWFVSEVRHNSFPFSFFFLEFGFGPVELRKEPPR
ncbi:hypothetical protein U1Q18_036568, partial [Sarracenia purpurea var. burkii]